MISVACREGRCDQCQRCTGCSCHDGGMPADFRERVARLAAAAGEPEESEGGETS